MSSRSILINVRMMNNEGNEITSLNMPYSSDASVSTAISMAQWFARSLPILESSIRVEVVEDGRTDVVEIADGGKELINTYRQ